MPLEGAPTIRARSGTDPGVRRRSLQAARSGEDLANGALVRRLAGAAASWHGCPCDSGARYCRGRASVRTFVAYRRPPGGPGCRFTERSGNVGRTGMSSAGGV